MDMLINGTPLSAYGGEALLDYSIGPTQLSTDVFQGINRTNWTILKTMFGLRAIEFTVVFEGNTLHEAKVRRSRFNAQLVGKADLFIPDDGFYYEVYGVDFGAETLVGIGEKTAKVRSRYKVTGMRHDPLQTVTLEDYALLCLSTVPLTACRLTHTVPASASSYRLGSAVVPNVAANDVLVWDGFTGTLTKNGTSILSTATWKELPALASGQTQVVWGPVVNNTVSSHAGTVKVEYYPTYI